MKAFIGIIGAKRAGKDTAFESIQLVFPGAVKITLAAKLKRACAEATGIPLANFDLDEFKEAELEELVHLNQESLELIFDVFDYKPDFDKFIRPHIGKVLYTPRKVAQYVGTEVLRAYDPACHCKGALVDKVGDFGVITDVRFPNEYEYFKKRSEPYSMLYIQNRAAEIVAAKDTHLSESYLGELVKKSDFKIENNESLRDFQSRVQEFAYNNIRALMVRTLPPESLV